MAIWRAIWAEDYRGTAGTLRRMLHVSVSVILFVLILWGWYRYKLLQMVFSDWLWSFIW